jgi:two-component system, chemotaxis family, protein-glutamate methylesterase/glutaminase
MHADGAVVAGASAGGVETLVSLVRAMPADFPLPVLVVLHLAPTGPTVLPAILARAGTLPAEPAAEGLRPQPGHVYVAPSDHHLEIAHGRLRLTQGAREHGHRPAIDPTMRSAAAAYGPRAVGLVLSGARADGTAGLLAIKAAGGSAIAQDPAEALYPAMPASAVTHVDLDAVLSIGDMPGWIGARVAGIRPVEEEVVTHVPGDHPPLEDPPGPGTRYTCPDCGGVLFEHREGTLERYECNVGHVFSIESLASAQAETLEGALWTAVRSLEDRAALLLSMGDRARNNGHDIAAGSFERQATDVRERAAMIREAILTTSVADEQPGG